MNDLKTWEQVSDLDDLENVDVAPRENLLILDGNNVAYRYIKRANYNDFGDDYIRTVQSLGKSYGAVRIIICFDFGKSYYRINLHEEYKGTRKKPETEKEQKHYDEFFGCLNRLIDYLPDVPIEFYKYRGVEADDLIAFFTENVSQKYKHTWIVSSDKDLYQLIREDVSIFNLFSRKEISIDTLLENTGCTPEEYLLCRYIWGDSGDNILGVEGIGEKRSQVLARTHGSLDKLIKALPIKGSRAKYITNLNSSKDILLRNEILINLKSYNEKAIKAGKDGKNYWSSLQKIV